MSGIGLFIAFVNFILSSRQTQSFTMTRKFGNHLYSRSSLNSFRMDFSKEEYSYVATQTPDHIQAEAITTSSNPSIMIIAGPGFIIYRF